DTQAGHDCGRDERAAQGIAHVGNAPSALRGGTFRGSGGYVRSGFRTGLNAPNASVAAGFFLGSGPSERKPLLALDLFVSHGGSAPDPVRAGDAGRGNPCEADLARPHFSSPGSGGIEWIAVHPV